MFLQDEQSQSQGQMLLIRIFGSPLKNVRTIRISVRVAKCTACGKRLNDRRKILEQLAGNAAKMAMERVFLQEANNPYVWQI